MRPNGKVGPMNLGFLTHS